ncbi:RES family NAD+ phosphorylase [Telmatospirillum sp. J64-1]|uniref:RES family NAD+ phosphorylase n=1 Tax=Telmatospirillum sp. J64-1 TaxID=2502183 RepID=UPI00115EA55D|nr:RES domain-containing protein [Telmatospirillum sp. J64-1]
MTIRVLNEPLTAYRIGDPEGAYPIWSPEGAKRMQGRWHKTGAAVIYASERYSTAMLEKLVHYNGLMPPNQHFLQIAIPAGISYEVVNPDLLPGWHSLAGDEARQFGHQWYTEQRSAILIVPSVVARMERNFLFNANHPEFPRIKPDLETPIYWDARLFK